MTAASLEPKAHAYSGVGIFREQAPIQHFAMPLKLLLLRGNYRHP